MICPVCGSSQNIFLKKWTTEYDLMKCRKCSLNFASPMNGFRNIYNQAYEDGGEYNFYLKMAKDVKVRGAKALGWPYKTLLKQIKNIKGKSIFEVGCGCGHFLFLLNSLGYESNGCDISSSACNVAKKVFNLNIINSDFNESVVENNSLDIIIAFELIEHLEDPLNFLKLAHSKLKKGGYLFLSTPDADTNWPLRWQKKRTVLPPFHLTIFSKQTLTVAADRSGFKIANFIQKPIPFRYEFMEESFSIAKLFFEAFKSYLKGEKGATLFCVMESKS